MQEKKVAVIILAAGMGTRMKSDKAKVLHEILGKPMVLYVVETAKMITNDIILVIGNQAEKVREVVSEKNNDVIFALQEKQLGTGHAVLCAISAIPEHIEDVIILCGDVPLIRSDTLMQFIDDHTEKKRDVSLLAVQVDNPKGYGRILTDKKMNLVGIVEEADATDEQKKIKTINTGIYCVKKEILINALQQVKPDNAQGEFYLTDIIEIAYKAEKVIGVLIGTDANEVVGVNTPHDLMTVETIINDRQIKMS
ncbi:sugar phosphate nucleotidyltransferase [Desulfonema magnum]|uniref:Nucleotidyl transferase domain-containing protein n=1 Tax=Desulfonema magnum TaxID=45655 RepID=A0A975BWS1_9BACT|nr:sugar phosphate nucleotidyltransferase [Desulfonema magnum]QTA93199.1 Nucleotidyl transferase domain-containing protein [Desulfonema magnum]